MTRIENRVARLERNSPELDAGPDRIQLVGVYHDGSYTEPVTIYEKNKGAGNEKDKRLCKSSK